MGILDSLFGSKPKVNKSAFAAIIPKLTSELELIRIQFVLAGVTTLKSEEVPLGGISPMLQKGSELDSVLKGFQLTIIMGFAWNYMKSADHFPFDRAVIESLDDGDADITMRYRERYLDCQGNIDLLASSLAEDVHIVWGRPEPSDKFKRALGNAAITLGIVSQATIASVFGDTTTERKLKRRLNM